MFAIRDYDGFEIGVHSFGLQDFHQIGFDSDIYFEKIPEFNRANQCTIPFGQIYKDVYKFTNYWDDDHKDDADI